MKVLIIIITAALLASCSNRFNTTRIPITYKPIPASSQNYALLTTPKGTVKISCVDYPSGISLKGIAKIDSAEGRECIVSMFKIMANDPQNLFCLDKKIPSVVIAQDANLWIHYNNRTKGWDMIPESDRNRQLVSQTNVIRVISFTYN